MQTSRVFSGRDTGGLNRICPEVNCKLSGEVADNNYRLRSTVDFKTPGEYYLSIGGGSEFCSKKSHI
jgi:hypothetical protein